MPRTYHVLTESEPFSQHDGGAISRWTANIVRADGQAVVVAPSADASWKIARGRVRVAPGLNQYRRLVAKGGALLPWTVRLGMVRRALAEALSDLRAGDTVWIHNRPEFAAALEDSIRERGARLFLHLHNSHLVQWSERVTTAFEADCYVFVSQYLEREALQRFPRLGRTEVLLNGADDAMFFPAGTREERAVPVVLYAGRLVADKGVHVLLDAMRVLEERRVKVRASIVGSSGFGQAGETAYVTKLHSACPGNVRFEPYCSGHELAAKFRKADIFCLPSCWQEPLGLAPIEAMASGLPVVATDSGGLPETLADGGGMLVARNSVEQLAEALERLATDQTLRRRLAREAHASFQRSFTWSAVQGNYARILRGSGVEPGFAGLAAASGGLA